MSFFETYCLHNHQLKKHEMTLEILQKMSESDFETAKNLYEMHRKEIQKIETKSNNVIVDDSTIWYRIHLVEKNLTNESSRESFKNFLNQTIVKAESVIEEERKVVNGDEKTIEKMFLNYLKENYDMHKETIQSDLICEIVVSFIKSLL